MDDFCRTDIYLRYCPSPADLAAHRWGYKKGHEVARRMPCFRGALGPAHPAYPQDSPAAVQIADVAPAPIDAPKVAYSAADDEAIDTCLRNSISTTFHSVCHFSLQRSNENSSLTLNSSGRAQ
jgi:alcohol oxidase